MRIDEAVVVVVGCRCRRTGHRCSQGGDVGEGACTIIPEQQILARAAPEKEVLVAIVVEIDQSAIMHTCEMLRGFQPGR